MIKPSRIKTFLWFDGEAEQAAKFYTSIFKDSKIGSISRYPENGGPQFKFTEAVSFMVECKDQKEIDDYWDKLLAGGGKPVQCGWLKDRFGLSWQVAPANFEKLYRDPKTAPRVMQAMMKMVKLDMRKLEEAAR